MRRIGRVIVKNRPIVIQCSTFINYQVLLLLILLNLSSMGQTPVCNGEAGKVEWQIFEITNGNALQNPLYPQSPGHIKIIESLETEANYNDFYASIIKGFLKVPESGKYLFNVTGSDQVDFYLSSDEKEENKTLLVKTSYTSYSQYDQSPDQTDSVDLIVGNYYYFEIQHTESTGDDLIRVSWKTPVNNQKWQTIGKEYIYGYTCNKNCLPKGTPCNDNNAETTNDQYDGACNCFGIPTNLPECVGEYGHVKALYFDSIPGTDIAELLKSPSYPLQPSRAEILTEMRMPYQSSHDSFGSLVKACLTVPVSGTYEFSAIGNTYVEIYLGLLADLSDLTLIANSSGKTSSKLLNANQFYYLKLIHKENLNQEEFAMLWKTPFQFDNNWKYVDGAYLFQYNCELACIPKGTPCNDGNPETIKDAYDGNCNCTGIYCPNGNCPESTIFPHYDACASTGKHGTYPDDSWLSCEPKLSMNSVRGKSQWIQYDLGSVMPIGQSHIWNYNVAGNTGKGFKNVAIDLSTDGLKWDNFGLFEWAEASGTNDYSGFEGPNFTGRSARYILITGLTNWDVSTCIGFSEIKFKVANCPAIGTPCNDNDSTTKNDRYDMNCICKGDLITTVHLNEDENYLKLFPNPSNYWTNIVFYLDKPSTIELEVFDITGKLIYQLAHNQYFDSGIHYKKLPAQNMGKGQYLIKITSEKFERTEKLLVFE
jgi:hypothetical protein